MASFVRRGTPDPSLRRTRLRHDPVDQQHLIPTTPAPPCTHPSRVRHPTEDDVRGVLAGVIDPELHVSIVELGMVDDVQVDPTGDVVVRVALTTAGCPLRHQIKTGGRVEGARASPGVADVSRASTRR